MDGHTQRYEETTRHICVVVEPSFLEEESVPEEHRYVWAYRITIENCGESSVQLISRHWRITDAHGRVREVSGPGVIGEQPHINPGKVFQYTSGAPLETPSGFMSGTYMMREESGESFDIVIPLFALDSPYESRQIH
nr:MAG: Co2+/Mg2+ efflux protein ApaG [Hyphomicrobiales bacterium]